MKKKVFSLFILIFLASCAMQTAKNGQTPSQESSGVESDSKNLPPKIEKVLKTPVIWHLIDPLGIELKLYSIDKKKEENILVETALSRIELTPGHWQIIGFKLQGQSFNVLNTSEKFIFKVSNKTATYAGSIVVQCPKVGTQHHKELKDMSFFNRYYFGSAQGLCEMIVGSKFKDVKRTLNSLDKNSKLPLIQGF